MPTPTKKIFSYSFFLIKIRKKMNRAREGRGISLFIKNLNEMKGAPKGTGIILCCSIFASAIRGTHFTWNLTVLYSLIPSPPSQLTIDKHLLKHFYIQGGIHGSSDEDNIE